VQHRPEVARHAAIWRHKERDGVAGRGVADNRRGEFYASPHKFNVPMHEAALAWLDRWLNR
jgi:hypothetical protein